MAKAKQLIEYRYYEMPQGHYVMALLGKKWEQNYGAEIEDLLHFHNYMEIGYCYWGNGKLTLEKTNVNYKGAIITIIPANIPHTTTSYGDSICKWEYLFIDIESFIRKEMQLKRLLPEEIIKRINKQGYVIQWSQNRALTAIVKIIIDEYRQQKPYYKDAVKGYLRALVIEMLRITEDMDTSVTFEEKRLSSYIERGVSYIADHYAEDIKMLDVADYCGLSESHFRRIFEESMSMKPLDYLNMIRIDKACEIIQNTDVSMEEIGYRVGYQTPSTFNRNFKKITGKTPYQWKKDEQHISGSSKNYKISAKRGW